MASLTAEAEICPVDKIFLQQEGNEAGNRRTGWGKQVATYVYIDSPG